ncbi:MAG: hypothetical protein E6614_12290 [Bradyrhizobium sp.]|uniref:hypothetical protein n=1 Tax=Bradyrhizobium sp. TaxID=376 RepID=UPI002910C54F|nr:hypothetical protein [Bradyrhizobium sp.]MDU6239725.1 hypothetical protein [Bradyrhizobium sp.]MDU6373218.1 hypothetical protein [Bradyrhizobium sp.]MDU6797952.1 hypothetical protein [Bradyrhizobium sp.]
MTLIRSGGVNCIAVAVRQSLLFVGERDQTILRVLKLSTFVRIDRLLGPFAVFGCFGAILSGLEHVLPFHGCLQPFPTPSSTKVEAERRSQYTRGLANGSNELAAERA